jgi:NAD(P)-dependent dehydrogenase (short-subunit alcohol dehydrogenase family)
MGTPSFALQDRIAVVTGAAQGIGAACARRLARDGAAVALWDVDIAQAQALADELRAAGAKTCAQRCDVSRKSEVDAALAATQRALGAVNALVNNAGIFKAADFLDISEADWDAVIDVNLKGSFLVAQAVARAMVAAGGGAIVNMSSVNGTMAIPSIASYNASKGGIDQLTRVMALSAGRSRRAASTRSARAPSPPNSRAPRCWAATRHASASCRARHCGALASPQRLPTQ